ncbi:hypothetical protein Tco_1178103 [Tanacetum coccineum]
MRLAYALFDNAYFVDARERLLDRDGRNRPVSWWGCMTSYLQPWRVAYPFIWSRTHKCERYLLAMATYIQIHGILAAVLLLGGAFRVDGNANAAAEDSIVETPKVSINIVTKISKCVSLLRGMVRVWCSTDCTDIGVVNGVGVRHTLHDKFTDSTFVENKDLGESNPSSSTRPKNLTQRNVRRRNVKDRTASSSGGASRASSHIGYSGEGSSFVHNEVH